MSSNGFAGRHGEDRWFLDADVVHVLEPGADFGVGLGIGVRVHVDDRVLRLVDPVTGTL